MRKRGIALLIVFSMMVVFMTPTSSSAVAPWVGKFIKIVLADANGGMDGWNEGGTLGSAVGEAVGRSIDAALVSGQGSGGSYEPPVGVKDSIGLEHNMVLKSIIGDEKLGELTKEIVDEEIESYLKGRRPPGEMGKTQPKWIPSKNTKKKTSRIFDEMLEDMIDPVEAKDSAVKELIDLIDPEARDVLLEMDYYELDMEIIKQNERQNEKYKDSKEAREMKDVKYELKGKTVSAEDIGYMLTASILEYSFDFWGGNDIDLKEDYIPQKMSDGGLRRLWRIVKADIKGTLDGGLIQGVVDSISAGVNEGSGQGNWNENIGEESLGSIHNKALLRMQGSENPQLVGLNYLIENGIEVDREVENTIRECSDPKGCIRYGGKTLEELFNKSKGSKMPVSDGFTSTLDKDMLVLFNEKEFDEVKIKEILNNMLNNAAKVSETEARILNVNEYKAMEERLDRADLPQDIIYTSIFVDMYLHSTAYWIGGEGPIENLDYLSEIGKIINADKAEDKDEEIEKEDIEMLLEINNKRAFVNGEAMMMDVEPILENGRTLVPFRFIGEVLGSEIDWIPETREVTYELDDTKISLFIDDTRILVNGVPGRIDVKPIIKNSRTLVPIRVISETLGFEVEWDNDTRTVRIVNR